MNSVSRDSFCSLIPRTIQSGSRIRTMVRTMHTKQFWQVLISRTHRQVWTTVVQWRIMLYSFSLQMKVRRSLQLQLQPILESQSISSMMEPLQVLQLYRVQSQMVMQLSIRFPAMMRQKALHQQLRLVRCLWSWSRFSIISLVQSLVRKQYQQAWSPVRSVLAWYVSWWLYCIVSQDLLPA